MNKRVDNKSVVEQSKKQKSPYVELDLDIWNGCPADDGLIYEMRKQKEDVIKKKQN